MSRLETCVYKASVMDRTGRRLLDSCGSIADLGAIKNTYSMFGPSIKLVGALKESEDSYCRFDKSNKEDPHFLLNQYSTSLSRYHNKQQPKIKKWLRDEPCTHY